MDKNCAETICSSKKDAMRSILSQSGRKASNQPTSRPHSELPPCPPDREELGNHTWTLMHTMAAYYPEKPSEDQRAAARNFIDSLSNLYACSHCAEHFREDLKESPPHVESRASLSIWMCEAHNRVNRLLDKSQFDCILEKLDRRWRTGESHCNNGLSNDHNEAE